MKQFCDSVMMNKTKDWDINDSQFPKLQVTKTKPDPILLKSSSLDFCRISQRQKFRSTISL